MEIGEIYREIAPKLQSYLMGNGCSYATACDIVQETFLRIWQRRDELSGDLHQVSGLAFTIARNYRNDLYRLDSRMVELANDQAEGEPSDAEGGASAEGGVRDFARPGEAAEEAAALRRRLKSSLERMPVQLLEAFALSRLGELTVKDIASGTGSSVANVKVRVHRARELFAELFKLQPQPATSPSAPDLGSATMKALMMLAAVDGEIDKEEMSLYHEIAGKFRKAGSAAVDGVWEKSVRAMAYIGFLSEMLTPEELVREYVREALEEFSGATTTAERLREVVALLERMAAADGDYSRIERNCVTALSKRLA